MPISPETNTRPANVDTGPVIDATTIDQVVNGPDPYAYPAISGTQSGVGTTGGTPLVVLGVANGGGPVDPNLTGGPEIDPGQIVDPNRDIMLTTDPVGPVMTPFGPMTGETYSEPVNKQSWYGRSKTAYDPANPLNLPNWEDSHEADGVTPKKPEPEDEGGGLWDFIVDLFSDAKDNIDNRKKDGRYVEDDGSGDSSAGLFDGLSVDELIGGRTDNSRIFGFMDKATDGGFSGIVGSLGSVGANLFGANVTGATAADVIAGLGIGLPGFQGGKGGVADGSDPIAKMLADYGLEDFGGKLGLGPLEFSLDQLHIEAGLTDSLDRVIAVYDEDSYLLVTEIGESPYAAWLSEYWRSKYDDTIAA